MREDGTYHRTMVVGFLYMSHSLLFTLPLSRGNNGQTPRESTQRAPSNRAQIGPPLALNLGDFVDRRLTPSQR